jgi:hypothetical protein
MIKKAELEHQIVILQVKIWKTIRLCKKDIILKNKIIYKKLKLS